MWRFIRFRDLATGLGFFLSVFLLIAIIEISSKTDTPEAWNNPPFAGPVAAIMPVPGGSEIINLTPEPLTINGQSVPVFDGTPFLLPAMDRGNIQRGRVSAEFPSDQVKVAPASAPLNDSPNCPICQISGDRWVIRGKHRVATLQVIPAGKKLIIERAQLSFSDGAGIYSRSPVEISDTQLDGKKWAFAVNLRAGTNVVRRLRVTGGTGLEFFGLKFSGTLNFIDGETELQDVSLEKSFGEDAINCKYGRLRASGVTIKESSSDAVDLDWVDGILENISIAAAKNDCLDFSSGNVEVIGASLSGCSDKAVSNGESNRLILRSVRISDSVLGIVNKDGSTLTEVNTLFTNVRQERSAFVKKRWWSP